jgi:acyl-coenzyme A synthetase/AMP-(fatty) acid ligase
MRGTFIEAVQKRILKDPDGIAVLTDARSVTNGELWAEAISLSVWLSRKGLSRGDIVGISIKDEYRNFVATLAAMAGGLGQIALATHDPSEARADLAKRLRLSAVLVDRVQNGLENFPALLPDFSFRATDLRGDAIGDRADADDECFYLSSSGTTGRAKIVPLSQKQLLGQAVRAQFEKRAERLYRPASIEFNNSRRHRLYCLAAGGTNVLVTPNRMSVVDVCHWFGVTLIELSAAQANNLLDGTAGRSLPADTLLQVRGSPVSAELRRRIMQRLTPRLAVGYGATESGSIATAIPGDHDLHPATLGSVHPGVDVEIVDENDRKMPMNQSGKIRVRSAGMATRYHDDDEATRSAFRNAWFYPGDMGHFGEEGHLRFDGRADDMIILMSINVFPSEIERVCETLPGVVECAAFSIKSGEFGDVPLLAVVSDGTTSPEAVLAAAKRILGLRAPRKVFFVEKLPRNAEGKIRRTELRRQVEERAAA